MITIAQKRQHPYLGLRPFTEAEADLFFGREDQADNLIERLQRNHFLAVVGASGNGKSSLVRAGLLPSLHSGTMSSAGSSWRVATLTPGDNPIHRLAHSLSQPGVLDKAGVEQLMRIIVIETTLRRSSLGLVHTVLQAGLSPTENILILVDQFEELFRFQQNAVGLISDDEAYAFVKLLINAASHPQIYVLLTMRSDFLGDCTQFQGLPEILNDNQYLISRMNREQLRRAIVGPIAVSGGNIAPRLVHRLLNDVGNNPDQLPILQHALMRTWNRWQADRDCASPMDLIHYEAIGGMANALSNHANEIYDSLAAKTTDSRRLIKIAEVLFKRLTERDSDNREIRRPTRLSEIRAVAKASETDVKAVINKFRTPECCFLVPSIKESLTLETPIDISHESLMRVWDKLKKWMEEEAQAAEVYKDLAKQATRYYNGEASLLKEPELSIYLKWQKENEPNSAWAERYASYSEDYDLRLLTADCLEDMPNKGKGLVAIAKIKEEYYVRVFDRSGNKVSDLGASEFALAASLQRKLEKAIACRYLNKRTRLELAHLVLSSLGYSPFEKTIEYLDKSGASSLALKKETRNRRLRLVSGVLVLLVLTSLFSLYTFQRNRELKAEEDALIEANKKFKAQENALIEANKELKAKENDLDRLNELLTKSAVSAEPAESQKLSQEKAVEVINNYLNSKKAYFGKDLENYAVDSRYITGLVLAANEKAKERLRENDAYYTYQTINIGEPDQFVSSETVAIANLCVSQTFILHRTNKADQPSTHEALWQFTFSKEEGVWKINNRRSLDDCPA